MEYVIVLLIFPAILTLGTVIYAIWQFLGARRLAKIEYEGKLAFYEGQQGDNPVCWMRPRGYDGDLKQYEREPIQAERPDKKAVIREGMRREVSRWFCNDNGVNQESCEY